MPELCWWMRPGTLSQSRMCKGSQRTPTHPLYGGIIYYIKLCLLVFQMCFFFHDHILCTSIKWMIYCFTYIYCTSLCSIILVVDWDNWCGMWSLVVNCDNCCEFWWLVWIVLFSEMYDKNKLWQCPIYKQNVSIFFRNMLH